jgi:predicted  nucleic acid-binding Zn-ribbon protein
VGPPLKISQASKGVLMQEFPFVRFLELVQYDQQAVTLNQQKLKLEKEVVHVTQQQEVAEKELDIARRHHHAMRRDVETKEAEMQQLALEEKYIQTKLDNIHNSKEYAPLKKELEHLRAKQHEFEPALIKAWQQAETAEKDFVAYQALYDEKVRKLQAQAEEKKRALHDVNEQLKQFETGHKERAVGLPAEWLEKYGMMKTRVPNPVVPVVQGNCSGCNFQIRPHDIAALRKRALVQCRECYRFLYMPEIMLQEPELSS